MFLNLLTMTGCRTTAPHHHALQPDSLLALMEKAGHALGLVDPCVAAGEAGRGGAADGPAEKVCQAKYWKCHRFTDAQFTKIPPCKRERRIQGEMRTTQRIRPHGSQLSGEVPKEALLEDFWRSGHGEQLASRSR